MLNNWAIEKILEANKQYNFLTLEEIAMLEAELQ
jgi:hypothetical protein